MESSKLNGWESKSPFGPANYHGAEVGRRLQVNTVKVWKGSSRPEIKETKVSRHSTRQSGYISDLRLFEGEEVCQDQGSRLGDDLRIWQPREQHGNSRDLSVSVLIAGEAAFTVYLHQDLHREASRSGTEVISTDESSRVFIKNCRNLCPRFVTASFRPSGLPPQTASSNTAHCQFLNRGRGSP